MSQLMPPKPPHDGNESDTEGVLMHGNTEIASGGDALQFYPPELSTLS